MNWANVFGCACGYERVGEQVRVYVESAEPKPTFNLPRGRRAELFHLYAGPDAEANAGTVTAADVADYLRDVLHIGLDYEILHDGPLADHHVEVRALVGGMTEVTDGTK